MDARRVWRWWAVMAVFGLMTAGCEQAVPTATELAEPVPPPLAAAGDVIPGQYIVVLQKESGPGKTNRQALNAVVSLQGVEAEQVYERTLLGFAGHLTDEARERLERDPRVAYIEPDRVVTLGPRRKKRRTPPPQQEVPWGIERMGERVPYTGGHVAWVLDTGIDLNHPDLNVDASRAFTAFRRGKDSRSADDRNGHGSHVAGTIAALDNDRGVVGVAAGATVVPVKVLNFEGNGCYSGVIKGIDYVGANGSPGDVANMSLGGPYSRAVNEAVEAAAATGIRFVLAAGNESADAELASPASAEGPNIYTISAIDRYDGFAWFSNYGIPIDYAAPGVGIYSTYKQGGYATMTGTSMAAPHAAGVLLQGAARIDGFAANDPDGYPDPIIALR